MPLRHRLSLLLALAPISALAGGLLGKTLTYYEPPRDPGDRYATFAIRTDVADRNQFGVILFSDPVQCKGQVVVRAGADPALTIVAAEKAKPFTLSANYLVWHGREKTTCRVVTTLVPTAARYEVVFGVDPQRKECTVDIAQAGADGVLTAMTAGQLVDRKPAQPMSQSGAFCEPMSEADAMRLLPPSDR